MGTFIKHRVGGGGGYFSLSLCPLTLLLRCFQLEVGLLR